MLNTATGRPWSIATCSAMFSASEVLPIEGRPAMTTRSPGCRPEVVAVEVDETGGHAGDVARILLAVELVDPFDDATEQVLQRLESGRAARAVFRDLEDLRFGLVEDLPRLLAHAG